MMISQPALICLEATLKRLIGRDEGEELAPPPLARAEPAPSAPTFPPVSITRPAPRDAEFASAMESSRVPNRPESESAGNDAPLTADERRARAAALRALALSRGRRFEAARAAFIEASRLDPALDLTRTPSFWSLERAAHEAAVAAYVETGRDGDAAVLRARINSTYRPKPLRAPTRATATP